MSHPAIAILDELVGKKHTKARRLERFLKDHAAKTSDGWYMCVPSCFHEALDIQMTPKVVDQKQSLVWTQGSAFYFKIGDTLYDCAEAYGDWATALQTIKLCIRVKTGSSAGPVDGATSRTSGTITFGVLRPDAEKSKLVEVEERTMSQDDFVRFLIAGPSAGTHHEQA